MDFHCIQPEGLAKLDFLVKADPLTKVSKIFCKISMIPLFLVTIVIIVK